MDASIDHAETRNLKASLNDFFYSKETPYGLALVRIFLPGNSIRQTVQRRRWP